MPKRASWSVFEWVFVDDRPQQVTIKVKGVGCRGLFRNESGGHRWQRVPPNERSGRVHSSTVTVAVLGIETRTRIEVKRGDLEIQNTIGSGPGGQNRQKVATAAQITHIPSGIMVRCETERSLRQNIESGIRILESKLNEAADTKAKSERDASRKMQVGSGERSDKIRTVQVQNGHVTNHLTGRKFPLKEYLKGNLRKVAS